jgi:NTE family protein
LLADQRLPEGTMKDVLIHMVSDDATMTDLGAASKATPALGTLRRLKEAGQAAADRFLSAHGADLGQRASVDLAALFS